MSLSRRQTLTLIGGGLVLAATGRAGAIMTRTPDAAMLPWSQAGQGADPRLRALSFALLAPNPHNRQPWLARLDGTDEIMIYRDAALNLPATDPFDRQLTIGMGCFLELLSLAAAQDGFDAITTLFPDGEALDQPVAHVRLTRGGTPDPLFAHTLNRHTNRDAYDLDRGLSMNELKSVIDPISGARGSQSNDIVTALRDLTLDAMITELKTKATYMESVELTRIGAREINATPDGLTLRGPMMEALASVGMLTREQMARQDGPAFDRVIAMFETSFSATPGYVWVPTGQNTRRDQIAAGRTWMRLHLSATAQGLALHPVSQSLQEYPEVQPHYRAVHDLLAPNGDRLQMLARIGYGPQQPPAPRWPLEKRLIND